MSEKLRQFKEPLQKQIEGGGEMKRKEKVREVLSDIPFISVRETSGAYKTSYIKPLIEMVTGELVEELPKEDEPERTVEFPHLERREDISNYFKEKLRGKRTLDLGCGIQGGGYRLARYCKTKDYIGVEKYFAKSAHEKTKELKGNDGPPFTIIQEDLTVYLRRSERAVADVVILSGIDINIIPEKDWGEMIKNIHVILSKNGLLIVQGGGDRPRHFKELADKFFIRDSEFEALIEKVYRSGEVGLLSVLPTVYIRKD